LKSSSAPHPQKLHNTPTQISTPQSPVEQPSIKWHDRAAMLNGYACLHIQWLGRLADHPCRRRNVKERRPLVLCVRETPFNRIHLSNMMLASEAGATIFPCMRAFYQPGTDPISMTHQFVCRVLAHIGLPQTDAYVWKPEE